MSNIHKLKVGQVVLVVSPTHRHSQKPGVQEHTIEKIGFKYFFLTERRNSFHIDTLRENIDSNYRADVWLSLDAYQKHIRIEKLSNEIAAQCRAFSTYQKSSEAVEELHAAFVKYNASAKGMA